MKKLLLILALAIVSIPVYASESVARYCDFDDPDLLTTKANITLPEGENSTPLCVDLINNTETDEVLHVKFVDAEIAADGSRICGSDNQDQEFGQYVQDYENIITVPARSKVRIEPQITLPTDKIGDNYGCIAYYDYNESLDLQAGGTLIRTAHVIRVYMDHPVRAELDVSQLEEGAHLIKYNQQIYAEIQAENPGDLLQTVTGEVIVKEWLHKPVTYLLTGLEIQGGASDREKLVIAENRGKTWPLQVITHLYYKAHGNADSAYITPEMLEMKKIEAKSVLWVLPWYEVGYLLIGLILLVFIGLRVRRAQQQRKELTQLRKKTNSSKRTK